MSAIVLVTERPVFVFCLCFKGDCANARFYTGSGLIEEGSGTCTLRFIINF